MELIHMKKSVLFQFLLGLAVLFAILYPSLDGVGHLEKELTSTHCDHHYTEGKNEINHTHQGFEKCFACEFMFSQFIASEIFMFVFRKPIVHSGYVVSISKEITQFFRGSLFSHRGPPVYC